jgi:hypothetical protein
MREGGGEAAAARGEWGERDHIIRNHGDLRGNKSKK